VLAGGGALVGAVLSWLFGSRRTQKALTKAAEAREAAAAAEGRARVLEGEKTVLEGVTDRQAEEAARAREAGRLAARQAEEASRHEAEIAGRSPDSAGEFLDRVLENEGNDPPRDSRGGGTMRGSPTAPMGTRPDKKPR
jgi:hypothetical protein